MSLFRYLTKDVIARLTGIGLLLVSLDAATAGNPTTGKTKAAVCIGCHVPDAVNPNPLIPTLSGQHADYIVQELLDYQAGRRKDPVMPAMVKTLSGIADMFDIAAYYASLAQMSGDGLPTPLSKQCEELFESGRCTFCHGDSGSPDNHLAAPSIGSIVQSREG